MTDILSRSVRCLLLVACAMLVAPCVLPAPATQAAEKVIAASSRSGQAIDLLDQLVNGIGARQAGTASDVAACKWAEKQFEQLGLSNVHRELCAYQPSFTPADTGEARDKPVQNVVAEITGTEFPDQYVIVGAHIDSDGPGTGAEDNGVGVAATIEAARLIVQSGVRPRRTIRFVLFGGEEAMLLGSRSYVLDHPDIVAKTTAMFNMDGGGRNPISGLGVTASMADQFSDLAKVIATVNPEYGFALKTLDSLSQGAYVSCGNTDSGVSSCSSASPLQSLQSASGSGNPPGALAVVPDDRQNGTACGKAVGSIGTSDHTPFLVAGVPALMWMQEGHEPYYAHTARDTFESVKPDVLQHSAVVVALSALAVADLDQMIERGRVGTVPSALSACGIGN